MGRCRDCKGSGEVPCFHCYGSGKGYGPDKKCNYCKGRKTDTCLKCNGTGESNN